MPDQTPLGEPSPHRKLAWIVAAGWTAAIMVMCSLPARELPEPRFTYLDKVGHFVAFWILAWAWFKALGPGIRSVLIVVLGGMAFGAMTEIYQAVMPLDRSADVYDWASDSAGIVAGWISWEIRQGRRSDAPGRSRKDGPL